MREEVTLETVARQLDLILAETKAAHEDFREIRRGAELVAAQCDAIDVRLEQLHQWASRAQIGFVAGGARTQQR
jgi:hypothetical protein